MHFSTRLTIAFSQYHVYPCHHICVVLHILRNHNFSWCVQGANGTAHIDPLFYRALNQDLSILVLIEQDVRVHSLILPFLILTESSSSSIRMCMGVLYRGHGLLTVADLFAMFLTNSFCVSSFLVSTGGWFSTNVCIFNLLKLVAAIGLAQSPECLLHAHVTVHYNPCVLVVKVFNPKVNVS